MKYVMLLLCLIPGIGFTQTWTEEGGSSVISGNVYLSAYTVTTSTRASAGTWVSVEWSSTVYNSGFTVTSASITVNTTAKYLFICTLGVNNTSGGNNRQIMVRAIRNGSEIRQSYIQAHGSNNGSGSPNVENIKLSFIENVSTADNIVFQYTGNGDANAVALTVNNQISTYSEFGALPSVGQLTILKISQ